MEVQTFETTEVTSSMQADDIDKIKALTESLELTGQKTLLTSDNTRFVYRKMTREEANVYGLLCSQRTKLEDYADQVIPLRVLQVAAHAKALNFFRFLTVWHPESAEVKDPVLVGFAGESDYSGAYYILARWGETLEPFETLKEKAYQLALIKLREGLSVLQEKARTALLTAETRARRFINGENITIEPSVYGVD